jgi:FkbM family methyltransferase
MDDIRARIVSRGIQVMCGTSHSIPDTAAAGVPLVSAGLRLAWLKALRIVGVRDFVAASGLGYNFVCHVGDLAAYPFYHRRAFEAELEICTAWLLGRKQPVVYDVGANVGFFATHLAQMLAREQATIFAFEPVPTTFIKLLSSVQRLGLSDRVHPVASAVSDCLSPLRISYSRDNSLYAQVTPGGLNPRVGDRLVHVAGITLDAFLAFHGVVPALLKIDVEGSEAAVLRGAQKLLSRADRPAIIMEYNPITLSECGVAADTIAALLRGYMLYYIDDIYGQRFPLGSEVQDLGAIDWCANLFAVPRVEGAGPRWEAALGQAVRRLEKAA